MKVTRIISTHTLFFVLLVLFVVIAILDLINVDSSMYKSICTLFSPLTGSVCTDYYDVPIWIVYLTVSLLAALYHVHAEIKISNKHLSNHKH